MGAKSSRRGTRCSSHIPNLESGLKGGLDRELTVDLHAIEYVGVLLLMDYVNYDDPMLSAIHDIMGDEFSITVADPPFRPIIRAYRCRDRRTAPSGASRFRMPFSH